MMTFPFEMAVNIISFWARNLTLNHVKFICHSYFSVLIIEVCQSANSFVSVSLPLCTQTKWAPVTVIICFRKAISIHRIKLRLETSQPKWEFGLRNEPKRQELKALALGWLEKECCQMSGLWHSWILQNPGSCGKWALNHWDHK